jgi:hypothetical protein
MKANFFLSLLLPNIKYLLHFRGIYLVSSSFGLVLHCGTTMYNKYVSQLKLEQLIFVESKQGNWFLSRV